MCVCVCWVSSTYAHSQPRPFCFVPRCCAPVVLCSRGLLNDTCKALLQEARRRGLVAPPSNTEVCQLSLCMSEPVCLYLSVSVCPPPHLHRAHFKNKLCRNCWKPLMSSILVPAKWMVCHAPFSLPAPFPSQLDHLQPHWLASF